MTGVAGEHGLPSRVYPVERISLLHSQNPLNGVSMCWRLTTGLVGSRRSLSAPGVALASMPGDRGRILPAIRINSQIGIHAI
ncbi:hypothetical protein ppKF707_6091 [Metapseudomonas furukawaii]|uniref:Uncharacterized protein n=1 Tax=Metapseudomonas furukawaii TaxID=1149133 RepID=A0AAD1FFF0_METFU|nr:hypothetical protein ppKF707_6091 [Pseudomonas furukawaii]BAU74216.1 hypothetical protein KF707C_25280 [Pseudomonas furukawaii]